LRRGKEEIEEGIRSGHYGGEEKCWGSRREARWCGGKGGNVGGKWRLGGRRGVKRG